MSVRRLRVIENKGAAAIRVERKPSCILSVSGL